MVGECVERLSVFGLQIGMVDRWMWKLHLSHKYTVQSAYSYLTAVNTNITNITNILATKDNLRKRNVLDVSLVSCAASCGELEDKDHLFFKCDHYGRLWLLISQWLGIDRVFHGELNTHSNQFCALGGFSKYPRTTFTVIWISVLFVIWKDRNNRIFNNQFVQIAELLEKVKHQTYWWLKANFITFDFDYPF